MPMIDCTTCRHWDVFEWRATLSARLTEGGFKDTPIHEHVGTCQIGLSPMEDGKTVTSQLNKCEGFKETIRIPQESGKGASGDGEGDYR